MRQKATKEAKATPAPHVTLTAKVERPSGSYSFSMWILEISFFLLVWSLGFLAVLPSSPNWNIA